MAVAWLTVDVRVWHPDGEQVADSAFLGKLKTLDAQPSALFAGLDEAGYEADVFIESWIDQDQFEAELPPEFISACSRVGLGVSLLTND